jgi:transcription factor MBP1
VEEAGSKLAALYDNEMKERDTNIVEAKQTLTDFEAQRHKVKQECYALMAKVADESKLMTLRKEYESCLMEMESLLEQKDHGSLQKMVRQQDHQAPPQAFRLANGNMLTQDQMMAAFPWAVELHRQQQQRRQLLGDAAKLMGDIGAGEKIGKCRKLVAIATGLKEEDLDAMSQELLESLESTQAPIIIDGPRTPPHLSGLEVA